LRRAVSGLMLDAMAIFKRSPKLEKTLADMNERLAALVLKRNNAELLLTEATEARSEYLLGGDLADDSKAAKLQSRVDTCSSQVAGLTAALDTLQAQIDDVTAQMSTQRDQAARAEASQRLAQQVAHIEAALPQWVEASRRLHATLTAVDARSFELDQLAQFLVGTCMSQIEIAAAFSLDELRRTVEAIRAGHAPVPREKVEAVVVEMPKADPMRSAEEVETVFVTRAIKYRDADGKQVLVQGWEDHALPRRLHARASAKGLIAPLTDERRRTHRGLLGGHRIDNPVDLDASGVIAQSLTDLPPGFERKSGLPPERKLQVPIGDKP
jgi:hypothetical protein